MFPLFSFIYTDIVFFPLYINIKKREREKKSFYIIGLNIYFLNRKQKSILFIYYIKKTKREREAIMLKIINLKSKKYNNNRALIVLHRVDSRKYRTSLKNIFIYQYILYQVTQKYD